MQQASSTLPVGGRAAHSEASGSPPPRADRRAPRSHTVRMAVFASVASSLMVFGLVLPVSRRLIDDAAESAAVEHAGNVTADTTNRALRPLLTDGVLSGDPAAMQALDRAGRDLVGGPEIVHVRIWDADGVVRWSDDADLIGQRFQVPDVHRALLGSERIIASVSDLGDRHDPNDDASQHRLVEVYYGTRTLGGVPVVVETYAPYELAARNAAAVRERLIPLVSVMIGVLAAMQAWLVFLVGRRLAQSERRRSELLRLAGEASDAERRRLAAEVHDGVVQDLTAVSFALTAAANEAGRAAWQRELHGLAQQTRAAVTSMRDLISRIYPVEVPEAGWVAGLDDVIRVLERQGVTVDVSVDDRRLSHVHELILLRITREALRNVARHANARNVSVHLVATRQRLALSVTDDGDGFDAAVHPAGHFGLHLLRDLARDHGGSLDVVSSPGAGTSLRFGLAGTS